MTSDPIEISVQEVAEKQSLNPDLCLVDVREEFERQICKLEGSRQLTESLAEEMIQSWDKEREIIFYCHHGGRSRAAAEYFQQQGFERVFNMTGGMDAWAREVDPKTPRY